MHRRGTGRSARLTTGAARPGSGKASPLPKAESASAPLVTAQGLGQCTSLLLPRCPARPWLRHSPSRPTRHLWSTSESAVYVHGGRSFSDQSFQCTSASTSQSLTITRDRAFAGWILVPRPPLFSPRDPSPTVIPVPPSSPIGPSVVTSLNPIGSTAATSLLTKLRWLVQLIPSPIKNPPRDGGSLSEHGTCQVQSTEAQRFVPDPPNMHRLHNATVYTSSCHTTESFAGILMWPRRTTERQHDMMQCWSPRPRRCRPHDMRRVLRIVYQSHPWYYIIWTSKQPSISISRCQRPRSEICLLF